MRRERLHHVRQSRDFLTPAIVDLAVVVIGGRVRSFARATARPRNRSDRAEAPYSTVLSSRGWHDTRRSVHRCSSRVSHQFAIDAKLELVNELDEEHPHLAFPHSSEIEGELRALPCQKGRTPYRILYRRSDHFVIRLHLFAKNAKAVPEPDKTIARARWDDFRSRIDANPRKFPSRIGKPAPSAARRRARLDLHERSGASTAWKRNQRIDPWRLFDDSYRAFQAAARKARSIERMAQRSVAIMRAKAPLGSAPTPSRSVLES